VSVSVSVSASVSVTVCVSICAGASGGAIVYYGDPILPNGEYQKCYSYATITGVRKVKEASIS